jgi:hypothetical protein
VWPTVADERRVMYIDPEYQYKQQELIGLPSASA